MCFGDFARSGLVWLKQQMDKGMQFGRRIRAAGSGSVGRTEGLVDILPRADATSGYASCSLKKPLLTGLKRRRVVQQAKQKPYNTGYSLVVTDQSTNPALSSVMYAT
jgi:20S proteasome alpha/beta subunit